MGGTVVRHFQTSCVTVLRLRTGLTYTRAGYSLQNFLWKSAVPFSTILRYVKGGKLWHLCWKNFNNNWEKKPSTAKNQLKGQKTETPGVWFEPPAYSISLGSALPPPYVKSKKRFLDIKRLAMHISLLKLVPPEAAVANGMIGINSSEYLGDTKFVMMVISEIV